MPKFLIDKLKKEYGADSSIPYQVANKMGFMRGNQETEKGRMADKKHNMHMHGSIMGTDMHDEPDSDDMPQDGMSPRMSDNDSDDQRGFMSAKAMPKRKRGFMGGQEM